MKFEFTKTELRDLMIAFIVLIFCFSIATAGFDLHGIISCLPIVVIAVVIGSLWHELGHKFMAMRYGCQAEFKLWPLGLLIAVVTSFFGFVFASPGSCRIEGDNLDDEIGGIISVAGPIANMALALIFLLIGVFAYPFSVHSNFFNLIYLIGTVGFSVNSFLAVFNLLPLYTLDGTKVLKWSFKIWFITIAISAIMMLVSISIGAESMVSLLLGA